MECDADADCEAEAPYCADADDGLEGFDTSVCVECTDDGDCSGGYCSQGECHDDNICSNDDDCHEDTPLCHGDPSQLDHAEEPVCVECRSDGDCEDDNAPYCVQGGCYETNACANDDDCHGDTPYCDQDEALCTDTISECDDHDDCSGATPYCHNEQICVSEEFICTAQDCAGRGGVCDPEAGVDGDCVNADPCDIQSDCLDDHFCIDGACELQDEVCDCNPEEACVYNQVEEQVECVIEEICEPDAQRCDEEDENLMWRCNPAGTEEIPVPCGEGCEEGDEEGEAFCPDPEGQSCTNGFKPNDDGEPRHFDILWGDHTNSYSVDASSGCVSEEHELRTTGADLTFELELEPDEVGVVEMVTALDYATMYVMDECPTGAEIDSCVEPDGHFIDEDHPDGQLETLFMDNDTDQTQTYYVVTDTGTGAATQEAEITFVVSEQICSPGDDVCDDGELGECSTFGTHFQTDSQRACTDGCYDDDDPTVALCEPKGHSSCPDAEYFDGSQAQNFDGEIIDFHHDVTIGTGDCAESSGQSTTLQGPSAYYEVDLDEGERLNANLYSEFDAGVWFATACGDDDCERLVYDSDSTQVSRYVAPEPQTVYVAVQAVDADVPHGHFTLDLSIDPPECMGEEEGHVLGCDGDDLRYCDGSDFPSRYTCDGPCDEDTNTCEDPTGNTCLDPVELTLGDDHSGSFTAVDDELTPLACTEVVDDFDDPLGPDKVFHLDLDDNQLLDIDLDTISAYAGYYLLDDCPVATQDVADQCLYGSVPGEDGEYFIEDGGDYYIVVDSSNRFDPADFTLNVDATDATCMPDSIRCAGDDIEQCSDDGDSYELVTPCAISCDEDDIVCTAPDDVNDRCGSDDTYFIDGPGQIVDNFDRFSQQENLIPADECFDDGTDGVDAFYEFDLDPEEVVLVDASFTVDGDDSEEVGIYLSDGCPTDGDECLESDSASGSTTLDTSLGYLSEDGGTYTVGIAGISDVDSGEFSISFDFYDAECTPGEDDQCIDDDTAAECTSLGKEIESSCAYGCEDGSCLDKKGDTCDRPWVLEEEGSDDGDEITMSVDGNIGAFSDTFNPYSDGESCINNAEGEGPDAVVEIEAEDGDELFAELDSTYDGALWLATSCGDADDNCVDGAYENFGPGVETLEYTFSDDGTYFLVADSVPLGSTGSFDLDVTLTYGDDNGDDD